MEYREDEWLQLSGLQHFAFCRRQWALIHVEQLWAENLRTVEGDLLHRKAHDSADRESRGDLYILRGVSIQSCELGVSGQCDVIEFHRSEDGIPLQDKEGLWQPYPVEYKRGQPKENDADRLQLCGQAMCLEEMLSCEIKRGALFYGETRRRELVLITYDVNTETLQGKKRLRQIAKQCVNYGQRVQNSVFECKLDAAQCRILQAKLVSLMDEETDSLRFYYLGNKYDNKNILAVRKPICPTIL